MLAIVGNLLWFATYDVHDQAVFFLPALVMLCLAAPHGLDAAREVVAARLADHPRGRVLATAVVALPIFIIAARGPIAFRFADLSDYRGAREYGDEVAEIIEPNGVIIAHGSPSEWYGLAVFHFHDQLVDGVRPDVDVILGFEQGDLLSIRDSGRPMYMMAKPLDPYVPIIEIEPAGPIFRVRTLNIRRMGGQE